MKRSRRGVVGDAAHRTGRGRPVVAVAVLGLMAPLGTAVTAQAVPTPDAGFEAEAHNPVPPECPWMDVTKSPAERAQLLLEASTLEQRMRWLVEQPAASPFETTWRDDVVYPVQVPCTPEIAFVNGAHGYSGEGGTAFPVPIAEAATWDDAISFAKGTATARQSFQGGKNVVLGPGLAGGRDPRSGRTAEYYGEDPVLTGVLAAAMTRGLEEGNPDMPVVANLKHYVANEQEFDKELASSNIDERTFREIYNLSYEIAIAEGEPGSIMCSYNLLNNVYACENDVQQEILKDELGFEGFIMSDFGSVHSTAASLNAGMDMELNRPVFFAPEELHAALDAGEITVEEIDEAAFRVVRAFIDVGLFDHPLPTEPSVEVTTDTDLALAQLMAEDGSVLLHNDGILPLSEAATTVAVIGPTASNVPNADGISAFDVCSSWLPFGPGFPNLPCPDPVAPLDAITERVEGYGGTVLYDNGDDLATAAAVAASADVAIVFGYYKMGEDDDLEDLNIDGNGDALVSAVAAANPDTVVVLGAGSAVVMPWLDEVEAVLHTWYPGRQMGIAISNLLWGDVNPSGKLPMTFPRSLDEMPTSTPEQYPGVFADGSVERTDPDAIRQVDYTEGRQVGYRWYQAQGVDPLFPFGHGLSYTTYEYSDLKVTPETVGGETSLHVDFQITNTGDLAGEEVAQVYLNLPATADEQWNRLVGWSRVHLDPAERRDVRITLTDEEIDTRHLLEYWDEDLSAWTMPEGTFTFHVGASSEVLPLEATFEVTAPTAGLVTMVPRRVLDVSGVAPGAPQCVQVAGQDGVPADATGVVATVTTVAPNGLGHVVVYPGGASQAPGTSTVNFEPGKDVANTTFVQLGENGQLCYLTRGAGQVGLLVDVAGYTTDGSGIVLQTPERLLDTRSGAEVAPRTVRTVDVAGQAGVPADAEAVLVNVTVTGASQPGNLRVFPAGTETPNASVVNYVPGKDKANTTAVALGEDGSIALWSDSEASVDVVVDVLGWTTADSGYVGVTPTRVVDSRIPGLPISGPLTARTPYTIPVPQDVVPEGATAVVLNVTAIHPTTVGNLRVYPGTATTPPPEASAINYIVGRDIPNLVVVDLPVDGGINVWSDQVGGTTHLAVDVVGYVMP